MAKLFPRRLLSHISRSAPFLTCYYYINYVFAHVGRALFQARFFQVPTLIPFPIRVHRLILRLGNIDPTPFRNSPPKFDKEANQPFQQDNIIVPPCVAAPKSDRGRVNQLVLRADWNPSQSESYCLLLKPWLSHTSTFRRGGVAFRHTSYCCTPEVWQVLSVLEHPVLQ